MRIARVFPRKTKASPDDELAFFDVPGMFPPEVDEVHVSVAFTWDIGRGRFLAEQWSRVAPVKIGGPTFLEPSGEFVPGRYLKPGYTITSRGCPNRCWFCSVWRREEGIRELPIRRGWNVLDDNLLACSELHIRTVFAMLKQQKHRSEFTGGLEAARLKSWHVDLLADLRPTQMFFAYDTENDYEPLVSAAALLHEAGFTRHHMRCYVLIGYPKDTFEAAEKRLRQCLDLDFYPAAMLWRNDDGKPRPGDWRRFQRGWMRPAAIYAKAKAGPYVTRGISRKEFY